MVTVIDLEDQKYGTYEIEWVWEADANRALIWSNIVDSNHRRVNLMPVNIIKKKHYQSTMAPSIQVNCLLRSKMILHAPNIEQPVLLA